MGLTFDRLSQCSFSALSDGPSCSSWRDFPLNLAVILLVPEKGREQNWVEMLIRQARVLRYHWSETEVHSIELEGAWSGR